MSNGDNQCAPLDGREHAVLAADVLGVGACSVDLPKSLHSDFLRKVLSEITPERRKMIDGQPYIFIEVQAQHMSPWNALDARESFESVQLRGASSEDDTQRFVYFPENPL
jgi:hypothetical protein